MSERVPACSLDPGLSESRRVDVVDEALGVPGL